MASEIDRGSDKHGPRQDEELAHEVEGLTRAGRPTHSEEWKQKEPSGEDQPEVGVRPDAGLVGGTPAGMSQEDIEGRSELARALVPSLFPADRDALLDYAQAESVPDSVVAQLRELPGGRNFQNVTEVWAALGHGVEQERS
jgi:hypothetical protein